MLLVDVCQLHSLMQQAKAQNFFNLQKKLSDKETRIIAYIRFACNFNNFNL